MTKEKSDFPRRGDRTVYGGTTIKSERERYSAQTPKQKWNFNLKGNLPKLKMLLGVLAVLLLIIIYALFFRKNGTEVFVGDKSVGILEGRSVTAEHITETIEAQLAGIVGSSVQLNERISAEGVRVSSSRKKDVCTMEYLLPKIRGMVTYKIDAAIITVDGGRAAILATQEQAQAVLDGLQEPYLPDEGVNATVGFVENVGIVHDYVDSEEVLTQAQAQAYLLTTTTVTKSYTIQSGDSLSLIARKFDTTMEMIVSLNDGMAVQTPIRAGELIYVPEEKPMLSVKTVEVQVYTTVEPKTYEYRYDSAQPSAYQKVIQQGRAGQKESTIQITRINGFVDEEKEVSKNILVEPVPEIIVIGTQ